MRCPDGGASVRDRDMKAARSGSAAAAQRQRSGSAAAHAARPYAARGEGHSPAAPNDNDEICALREQQLCCARVY